MITPHKMLEPIRHPLLTALILVLAGCDPDLTQPGPTPGIDKQSMDHRGGTEPGEAAARRISLPNLEFDDGPFKRGRQVRRPMP